MLTRADILTKKTLPREVVQVPEWDGEVTVQAMTGQQRDRFEASLLQNVPGSKGKQQRVTTDNIRAKLVAQTVVDPETGARLFEDGDVVELGQLSAAALDRVYEVSARLSKITKEDVDEMVEKSGDQDSAAS